MVAINGIVRGVANANDTKGFKEFVKNISNYAVGSEITLQNVIGQQTWNGLNRSDKIKLGKAVMNNVRNGSLTGLEAVNTPAGKNQIYRVSGRIRMLTIFTTEYLGRGESVEKILELNKDKLGIVFVRCFFVSNHDDSIVLNVEGILPNEKEPIFRAKRELSLGTCNGKKIEKGNYEFKAILSLWFGFDRVFEERKMLLEKNIKTVCFLAPNDQMISRVAGLKFDEPLNEFEYTQYIQENFAQFKQDQLRELPFLHCAISLKNEQLR